MAIPAGSGRDQGVPSIADYLTQMTTTGKRLLDIATPDRLDDPIPSCPDWTITDLLRHVGATYRWAADIVGNARNGRHREMFGLIAPLDARAQALTGDAVIAWLDEGFAAIRGTLLRAAQAADPDFDCWTFMPDRTGYDFWARRQAHETAMHGIDAQLAIGPADDVAPVQPWFGADGIDELLTGFVARPGAALRSEPPRTLAVIAEAPDIAPADDQDPPVPTTWLATIGPDGISTTRGPDLAALDSADATLTGAPHDLYCLLWNRPTIGEVAQDGDADLIEAWHREVRIL
jgi:uncharacterized protein (TIGR03083 family)